MQNIDEQTIIDGVLQEFYPLTKIPRPSEHEKAVSDYLLAVLRGMGLVTVQDEKYNLIADKPASPGFENVPLTILQSHMDMVCVADEGVCYDPLTDGIKCKIDGDFLRAEGTSLGADDGIGIAEILYILKSIKNNGPIRAIFTVDEESGMTGAVALDKKWLTAAKYLINCDSEDYDVLTVGSAGSVNLTFSRPIKYVAAPAGKVYDISLTGLTGGHSGEEINQGRGNAIELMMRSLMTMREQGFDYALVKASGGRASNVIPSEAFVSLVTAVPKEKLQEFLVGCAERLTSVYGDIDTNLTLTLTESSTFPEKVFSPADTEALLNLAVNLHTGVYSMSQVVNGLVETSANIGVLRTNIDTVEMVFFPRSSKIEKIVDFCQSVRSLAKLTGFELKTGTISPVWKEKIGDLAHMMTETFLEQNGKPMKVTSIHAGLECSWHIQKNPELDMVSIGVTTHDIHSPQERVDLRTIAPQVRLITGVLEKIAQKR